MKAVVYRASLPITRPDALLDWEMEQAQPGPQDLLVRVAAIAVNPVDYKVRMYQPPENGDVRILGWDAVGEVVATGADVSRFQPGDWVFYAGDLTRPGCNAEYQVVDQRLVGRKPRSLSVAEAAALPLTSITAWELLFDHLALPQRQLGQTQSSPATLLVVGAAGGVGSILLQLAKRLTGATIIATASRAETQQWVRKLGADHVIDHCRDLLPQLEAQGLPQVTHVASLNGSAKHFAAYTELLAPFGKIALIDDPGALDVRLLKQKSLSLHWEFMFARSMFQAPDMVAQGELLNRVADLVDQGCLKTTLGEHLGTINASNLKHAHAKLEEGTAIGKIVLEGFE